MKKMNIKLTENWKLRDFHVGKPGILKLHRQSLLIISG